MGVLPPFPNFPLFPSFYSTLRQYRVTLSCWESGLWLAARLTSLAGNLANTLLVTDCHPGTGAQA